MTVKDDGHAANRLLTDPAFVKAMQDAKTDIYRDFIDSNYVEKGKREDCYHMLRALDKLESVLKRYVNKGKADGKP